MMSHCRKRKMKRRNRRRQMKTKPCRKTSKKVSHIGPNAMADSPFIEMRIVS